MYSSVLKSPYADIICSHVFNAGVTGRPNVDWFETHKIETIRINAAAPLTLADVRRVHNLLMVNYATGCIF